MELNTKLIIDLILKHSHLDILTCKMLSFACHTTRKMTRLDAIQHKQKILHAKLIHKLKTIKTGNVILLYRGGGDSSAAVDIMIQNRDGKFMPVYYSVTLSYLLHWKSITQKPWFWLNDEYYVCVFLCGRVHPRVELV